MASLRSANGTLCCITSLSLLPGSWLWGADIVGEVSADTVGGAVSDTADGGAVARRQVGGGGTDSVGVRDDMSTGV